MVFVTSDCHFNHKNILAYEPSSRGHFKSIEEMNEALIYNWNSVVSDEDTIYVVGDFFMGPISGVKPILSRLHGKIILVRGNHDTNARLDLYREHNIEVKDIAYLEYKGKFFILCHFPALRDEFGKLMCKDNPEVIYLYGHIHHNAPKGLVDNRYHIGADTNNLTPVAISTIWQEIANS